MCQHKTSRLRSQQPMVRPLYLQERNLRFYTSLLPSQEYFSFVHLGVVNVNKQSCSFKKSCCRKRLHPTESMRLDGFEILISWPRQPIAIQAFLLNFPCLFRQCVLAAVLRATFALKSKRIFCPCGLTTLLM